MALRNKTFRSSDEVFEALKQKAEMLEISESDVINKALKCFLGLGFDDDCASQSELLSLRNFVNNIVRLNNLKIEE